MPIRPELQARYDREMNTARSQLAAHDVAAATAAAEAAAQVFAGSRDAEELDLRHQALNFSGSAWRRAGQFPQAESAYSRLANAAAEELGVGSHTHLLGRYFVGLVRADADDQAGAAAALREAHDGFLLRPDAQDEPRLVGAALGLALLRLQRYDETIDVLRRYAGGGRQDESAASILHNLALALVQRGDSATALPFVRQALNLRSRLNGQNHPYYIETQLVEALALVESGQRGTAEPILQHAAAAVLAGGGESHPFFARSLLVEARALARLGDGAAAEALARRALFVVRSGGATPGVVAELSQEANKIGPLWRISPAARGPEQVRLWKMEMQHTLRRYQVHSLDFVESGNRPLLWYFFVPAALDPADEAGALRLARMAFADCNIALNQREPADANILDVTAVQASEPSARELEQTDFENLFRQRVWEPSPVFSLVEGTHSQPLAPGVFAYAFCAYLTLRGGRADVARWAALGLDRAELERAVAQPKAMLAEMLWR